MTASWEKTGGSGARRRRSKTPHRFVLPGGALVLVEPSHDVPLVTVSVAIRGGSAHDPDGQEGLLRAALRMVRRGGAGRTAHQIEDAIDALGAELGVEVGASSASLSGQVISRNVDAYVDLLGALLGDPAWDERELGRLLRETESEIIESRDSDRTLAQRAFRRAMFSGHPYGRSSSGTVASIRSITSASARAMYESLLQQKKLVIAFAGDVTLEKARLLAAKLVRGIPKGAAPTFPIPPTHPVAGRHLVFVDKPDRTQTQVGIGTLGTSPHDPDHVALGVANAVFGGTFTSRLMNEVRSKRGWSYGAGSRLAVDRQRQAFSAWTSPASADCAPCLALELELLDTFVKDGISPEETAFIKKFLVRSHAFEIDTAPKRVHQALDVAILDLPADFYDGYVKKVGTVTARQANAAITKRLSTDNLVIVIVGTAKETLPAVERAITNLASTTVVPFDAD